MDFFSKNPFQIHVKNIRANVRIHQFQTFTAWKIFSSKILKNAWCFIQLNDYQFDQYHN